MKNVTTLAPFVVRPSKGIAIVVGILCAIPTGFLFWMLWAILVTQFSGGKLFAFGLFATLALGMLLLTVGFASMSWRKRPFFEISERGIHDYGFFSGGYGLIAWKDIEAVRVFYDRSGTNLLLRIKNIDALIARRPLIIRPLLKLACTFNSLCGGHLFLPVSWSIHDEKEILRAIDAARNDAVDFPWIE